MVRSALINQTFSPKSSHFKIQHHQHLLGEAVSLSVQTVKWILRIHRNWTLSLFVFLTVSLCTSLWALCINCKGRGFGVFLYFYLFISPCSLSFSSSSFRWKRIGRSFCLRSTFQHDTSGMKCEVFYWICTVRSSIIWSKWTWFIIFFMKQHHLLSWRRYQESCGLSPAATSQRHQFLLPNLKSTVQAHRHNRCEICFMAEEAPAQKYHQLSCSLSSDDLSHFCGAWRSSILWPLHTCLPVHALDSAFGSF